jgi:hypothetical protein
LTAAKQKGLGIGQKMTKLSHNDDDIMMMSLKVQVHFDGIVMVS